MRSITPPPAKQARYTHPSTYSRDSPRLDPFCEKLVCISSVSDDDNFDFVVFYTKNHSIVAYAEFSITSKRAAQRLSENIWVHYEPFLNCTLNAKPPFARKARNILRNHRLMIRKRKWRFHFCLPPCRLVGHKTRISALALRCDRIPPRILFPLQRLL